MLVVLWIGLLQVVGCDFVVVVAGRLFVVEVFVLFLLFETFNVYVFRKLEVHVSILANRQVNQLFFICFEKYIVVPVHAVERFQKHSKRYFKNEKVLISN